MKLPVKDNSPLIGSGKHLVDISKVYTATAKSGESQLAVVFKSDDDKQITRWYNLKGFKRNLESPTTVDESGRTIDNWLMDKKGNRVEDEEGTEKCLSYISSLLSHAGLGFDAKGNKVSDADTDDLDGCRVGIFVNERSNSFGTRSEVKYTFHPDSYVPETTIDDLV
tara:strand:+ start:1669 stop:2169 length:501 start_codon:yes stop_codon:yes gene_type:complete